MTKQSSSTRANKNSERTKGKSKKVVPAQKVHASNAKTRQKSGKSTTGISIKRVLIPLVALLMLLVGVAAVTGKFTSPESDNPAMSLEVSTLQAAVGEPFTVKIYADSAKTEVNAVGAGLAYPRQTLEVTSVSSKNSAYPIEAVQKSSEDGVKIVRGVIGGSTGKKLVAEVTFVAKSSGKYTIAFTPDDTNLVASESNENIVPKSQLKNVTVEAYEQ